MTKTMLHLLFPSKAIDSIYPRPIKVGASCRKLTLLITLFFCSTFISFSSWSDTEPSSQKQTLVIGKVSRNPKKHYWYFKPIADYAANRMNDLGITQADVLFAKDDAEMIQLINDKRIDWISESAFSALKYQEHANAKLLLRKWKKGVPDYYSVFITHKKSGINSLKDLIGKKIALEDAGSTTAFFLPMVELLKQNLSPKAISSSRENAIPGHVSYAFAHQEINIATWVHKGITAAGAYSNLDWDKKDHTPTAFKQDLKIFHKTQTVPRSIELVGPHVSEEITTRLKEVLLKMHLEAEGKRLLKQYQKTSQFDEITPAMRVELEDIRNKLRMVEAATSQ